jgi:hypothetical protein
LSVTNRQLSVSHPTIKLSCQRTLTQNPHSSCVICSWGARWPGCHRLRVRPVLLCLSWNWRPWTPGVGSSGQRGLGIFLPAANSPSSFQDASREAETLPLILPTTALPLPLNPRKFTLRLIYRYSYSLGVSPTKFIMMRTARQTRSKVRCALNSPRSISSQSQTCFSPNLEFYSRFLPIKSLPIYSFVSLSSRSIIYGHSLGFYSSRASTETHT